MELFVEVDAERIEAEDEVGTGVDTLTTFTLDFFFLAGRQATEDEARSFSPGALLSFPLVEALMASFTVYLTCFFVEWEILQDVMLPRHHNLRELPRNDGKNIQMGFPNNYKQVPSI